MEPRTGESEEERGKSGEGSSTSQGKKGVDAVESRSSSVLVRGRDGSGFVNCEECKKDVPAGLISMHSCSLEAINRMNLETQLVEVPYEAKKPLRKKPKSNEPKAKTAKVEKTKKVKDPDVPKKPPSSFFLFMDDFRKSFKEANPDSKDANRVRKEAGEKWRSMTDEEKKPYSDKVAELKTDYEKAMKSYNAAEAEGEEGEGKGEHEEGAGYNAAEAEGEEGEGEGEHEEGADEKSDKEEAGSGEEEELTDEE